MTENVSSFVDIIVSDLHNRFDECKLQIKGFTVLKVSITQVLDQFEAKSFLGIEAGVR